MAIINTSIKNIKSLAKAFFEGNGFWVSFVFSLSLASFSLGVLFERSELARSIPDEVFLQEDVLSLWELYDNEHVYNASYFASRNGTKVYPIDCPSGNRIKQENRIFFEHLDQAYEAGYELSSQC